MNILGALLYSLRHQVINLSRLCRNLPVMPPSLGSMTLERDDVKLARELLRNRTGWFEEGPVKQYEAEFARWNGSKHAFAFMGGRVALSACIHALKLQPGDEVILPGYTCVVVPNAFEYAGVKTVYSDIELETFGLDADCLEEKITSKTKAILLHHLFGLVCRDYAKILEIANAHGVRVIEDCAHATGAEFNGRKVGTFGDLGFYSSEQSKVWNTVQGGMVVTNDEELRKGLEEFQQQSNFPAVERVDRLLHNVLLNYYQFKHPQRWLIADLAEFRYGGKRLISTTSEEMAGIKPAYYTQKMPAAVAMLGLSQFRKIDRFNSARKDAAQKWGRWCEATGYPKPLVVAGSKPVFLRYPVLVEATKKDELSWALKSLGVLPGVWFLTNIHPAERVVEGCPNADFAVKRCINLPTLGVSS